MTAKVTWPTWSASVDNGRSIPSHLKRALWRLSGICMPNLSNTIVASNCGPMKPRGVAWNGAGGWLIFSQSRQVNFSRTVSISLKRRGISSSVLVTSSPIFASRDPPQQAQFVGASMTTRSRSMSSGHGLRTGRLRVKADVLRLRRCGLRGKLILARRGDEFFELQLQLLEQPCCALGALPVQFAFELLDPQLEMRDQRLVVRQLRPRTGSHRLGSQPRLTLGLQRRQGTHK